jgi:RNA polymerase sigma factor (sigma-70 family)
MEIHLEDPFIEVEATLAKVSSRYGDEVLSAIKPVLLANLKNGRINTFTDNSDVSVEAYVLRVVENYLCNNLYLKSLQIEKADLVWIPLLEKVRKWIFTFFIRKGFAEVYVINEIVPELSQEASIQIMKAQFTYDTDFDPWAHIIVKDTCFKYMRSAMKKSVVPANMILELDDAFENQVEDNRQRPENLSTLDRATLITAIQHLAPDRREIIIQKYFYELNSKAIAEKNHKSLGAIYSLHFNAIESLRKILSD